MIVHELILKEVKNNEMTTRSKEVKKRWKVQLPIKVAIGLLGVFCSLLASKLHDKMKVN